MRVFHGVALHISWCLTKVSDIAQVWKSHGMPYGISMVFILISYWPLLAI